MILLGSIKGFCTSLGAQLSGVVIVEAAGLILGPKLYFWQIIWAQSECVSFFDFSGTNSD